MRHLGLINPESTAKRSFQIQIVDTPESLEPRVNTGFAAGEQQMNRTLVTSQLHKSARGNRAGAGF